MNKIKLTVEKRSQTGKGPARRLRATGKAPAVFYGRNREPVKLSVDIHEFQQVMDKGGRNTLFDLQVKDDGGTSSRLARLKERQAKPLDGSLIHLDFQEIFMDEQMEVTVPLEFHGKSVGVEMGGVFQIAARELLVSCLPGDIPESLSVDISNMEIGHSLHVSEITIPEGLTPLHEESHVVATVVTPKRVAEVLAEEEEAEEEAAATEATEKEETEAEKTE